jgi:hypothetical protein
MMRTDPRDVYNLSEQPTLAGIPSLGVFRCWNDKMLHASASSHRVVVSAIATANDRKRFLTRSPLRCLVRPLVWTMAFVMIPVLLVARFSSLTNRL